MEGLNEHKQDKLKELDKPMTPEFRDFRKALMGVEADAAKGVSAEVIDGRVQATLPKLDEKWRPIFIEFAKAAKDKDRSNGEKGPTIH